MPWISLLIIYIYEICLYKGNLQNLVQIIATQPKITPQGFNSSKKALTFFPVLTIRSNYQMNYNLRTNYQMNYNLRSLLLLETLFPPIFRFESSYNILCNIYFLKMSSSFLIHFAFSWRKYDDGFLYAMAAEFLFHRVERYFSAIVFIWFFRFWFSYS